MTRHGGPISEWDSIDRYYRHRRNEKIKNWLILFFLCSGPVCGYLLRLVVESLA